MHKSISLFFIAAFFYSSAWASSASKDFGLLNMLEKRELRMTDCLCKQSNQVVDCGSIEGSVRFKRNAHGFGRGTSSAQSDWGSCFVKINKPTETESYESDLGEAIGDMNGDHDSKSGRILRSVQMLRHFDKNHVINQNRYTLRDAQKTIGTAEFIIEFIRSSADLITFHTSQSHTGEGDGFPSSTYVFDVRCTLK